MRHATCNVSHAKCNRHLADRRPTARPIAINGIRCCCSTEYCRCQAYEHAHAIAPQASSPFYGICRVKLDRCDWEGYNDRRALHSTAPHRTALRGTALHCAARHCTALHGAALHCTARHRTARHCAALRCTALHCTALRCTALHGTALHSLHCTCGLSATKHASMTWDAQYRRTKAGLNDTMACIIGCMQDTNLPHGTCHSALAAGAG
jgi:hypothetical protein